MAGIRESIEMLFKGKDEITKALRGAQKSADQFEDGAKKNFREAGKGADALKDKVLGIKDIAGGVFLGNLLTKGFDLGVKSIKGLMDSLPEYTNRIDEMGKAAQKIDLPVENFQKLNYAAGLANVSQEKLIGSFNTLNKNLGSGSLVKFLNENNRALAAQVKGAQSNEEVFYSLADAIAAETDIGRRAALGNAAFGKSWADLVPLFAGGSQAIKDLGEQIPNLVDGGAIGRAQKLNDTITEIKKTFQGFADVVRGAAVEYILPYVQVLKEWLKENRELVKQKIAGLIQRMVKFVQDLIPKIVKVIDTFKKWAPVILAAGAAAGVFFTVVNTINAVTTAVTGAKTAFAILNAVIAKNPAVLIIGAIIAAVALLILGFKILAGKVGGLGPALEVVKNTILKSLLIPFNLVLDAVQGLTFALGKIPGLDWAKEASDAIGGFQDKINRALTGSTATLLESGVKGAGKGYREGGLAGAIGGGLAGAASDFTEPYRQARAEYLAEHPGEAASPEDSKWEAMLEEFKKNSALLQTVADNTGDAAEGIGNLGKGGPGSPAQLSYAAMGREDFWAVSRAGL
jgi:hypothetical protein